jgi:hypothetical protein
MEKYYVDLQTHTNGRKRKKEPTACHDHISFSEFLFILTMWKWVGDATGLCGWNQVSFGQTFSHLPI